MNAIEHRGESGGSARHGKGAVVWICGRVLRTGASPAGRVDKPVDNADALPTASPTLSRLSPTSSTGPTTGDAQRLPLPALRFNICVPLKPIPTSPTGWLTHNPSGSFPYGIRLRLMWVPGLLGGQKRGLGVSMAWFGPQSKLAGMKVRFLPRRRRSCLHATLAPTSGRRVSG